MMKKCLVFIGLLFSVCLVQAQSLPLLRPVPDYAFAHFNHNRILYPGNDSTAMERFFSKLDSVEKETQERFFAISAKMYQSFY